MPKAKTFCNIVEKEAVCGRPGKGHNMCTMHYDRWRKYGDPLKKMTLPPSDLCKLCGEANKRSHGSRECLKCKAKQSKAWRASNPARAREHNSRSSAKSQAARRDAVFSAYGNACSCCGETTRIFLALDHKLGGGNKHRRELGKNGNMACTAIVYAWVIKNGFPNMFQLLCHNCNFAKSNGGCPHAIIVADEEAC